MSDESFTDFVKGFAEYYKKTNGEPLLDALKKAGYGCEVGEHTWEHQSDPNLFKCTICDFEVRRSIEGEWVVDKEDLEQE